MAVSKASSKVMRSRMERRVLWGMLLLRDRALTWLLQGVKRCIMGLPTWITKQPSKWLATIRRACSGASAG